MLRIANRWIELPAALAASLAPIVSEQGRSAPVAVDLPPANDAPSVLSFKVPYVFSNAVDRDLLCEFISESFQCEGR